MRFNPLGEKALGWFSRPHAAQRRPGQEMPNNAQYRVLKGATNRSRPIFGIFPG